MVTEVVRPVIYGLHLRDAPGEIRYVGMTRTKISSRFVSHKSLANSTNPNRKKSAIHYWMRKHGTENIDYSVIEYVDDVKFLPEREMFWIGTLTALGFDLLNLTLGGEGATGTKHTDEWKMDASKRMTGRVFSEETLRRMSESKVGKSVNRTGPYPKMSEQTKAKLSAALIGRAKPDGHGAKVSLAIRGEGHGMVKLLESQVVTIIARLKNGERVMDLAKEYGVRHSQISRIGSGTRWAHLPR